MRDVLAQRLAERRHSQSLGLEGLLLRRPHIAFLNVEDDLVDLLFGLCAMRTLVRPLAKFDRAHLL